ncbi:hypothetical protein FA95DRAFT_1476650, partial [Auriscalpium vulgare]
RLQKRWTAYAYAFFHPDPEIGYDQRGRRYHGFKCMGKSCKHITRRYLEGKDASSTGNMLKHARSCWGAAAVQAAQEAGNHEYARKGVTVPLLRDGSITAAFERKGKGKITYSHRQHTKTETRVVKDRGFNVLMKTGRPEYYLPSVSTVSRDVRKVFVNARRRIAKMLQEYEGALSFATDAWSSPNHRAFIAISVHFELDGQPMCIILDVVEVARSHSGLNMALVF